MKKKGCLSIVKRVVLTFFLFLVVLLAGIALYNLTLPDESPITEQLSIDEQVRLAEISKLRTLRGNEIWPGWGDLEIPVVLYNEEYVFLAGLENPDLGWVRVPYNDVEGTEWEAIPGQSYHRQSLPESGSTPQAFTVRVGDKFAASMTTKDWTQVRLMKMIQDDLPGFLVPFMPYGLFINQFNSDWHICSVLHESFHAFQAHVAFDRLKAAELATALEPEYLWDDDSFRAAWVAERELLAKILKQEDSLAVVSIAHEWLAERRKRREKLSPELINYEKQREWLEGTAKYAELKSWMLGAQSEEYIPVPEMRTVDDFDYYQGGDAHREKEINQLKRDLQFSETMFYYSGWAQAELLDKLYPGWKLQVFEPGVFLDDLIEKSLEK